MGKGRLMSAGRTLRQGSTPETEKNVRRPNLRNISISVLIHYLDFGGKSLPDKKSPFGHDGGMIRRGKRHSPGKFIVFVTNDLRCRAREADKR